MIDGFAERHHHTCLNRVNAACRAGIAQTVRTGVRANEL